MDGKVKSFIKGDGNYINFYYDGLGHRIAKQVTQKVLKGMGTTTTHYGLDAQGNQLATYSQITDKFDESTYTLTEHDIYGSSRLGTQNYSPYRNPGMFHRLVGDKRYELSDHLGDVLGIINDRKIIQSDVRLIEMDLSERPQWIKYSDAEVGHTRDMTTIVTTIRENSGAMRQVRLPAGNIVIALDALNEENTPAGCVISVKLIDANDPTNIFMEPTRTAFRKIWVFFYLSRRRIHPSGNFFLPEYAFFYR